MLKGNSVKYKTWLVMYHSFFMHLVCELFNYYTQLYILIYCIDLFILFIICVLWFNLYVALAYLIININLKILNINKLKFITKLINKFKISI